MIRRTTLFALLGLLLLGCASGLQRPVSSAEAVADSSGVQRLDVDLHSFYFEPNRIVVHAGRPVELVLRNRSLVVPHNFTIVDSSLSVSVGKWGPGSSRVRFTPQTPGEYEFFCHMHGHAKKGMKGTLVVEP
jgi:plastocyanin